MTTNLYQRWLEAKKMEALAVLERRQLEDQMAEAFALPKDLDGTVNHQVDGYKIKMEGRINKKIDADKLQMLAAEAGLSEHLSALFRWRPELNTVQWKSCSEEIKQVLSGAITSTPGRPTFSISKTE
jgi:hypothetical protein